MTIREKSLYRVYAAAIVLSGLAAACGPGNASNASFQERRELDRLRVGGTVRVTELTRLSFVGLRHAPEPLARVFRLPDGGWGVSSGTFDGLVQRFDSIGTAAGTFGRRGEGPGEFGGMIFGVVVEDELWIADPGNGRLSRYSKDLGLLESRSFPPRVFSASPARRRSGILASGFFRPAGAGAVGRSVLRASLDERADVFGGRIPDTPETPAVQVQYAAATANGEVWTLASKGGAIDILHMNDLSLADRFRLPGVPRAEEIPPRLSMIGSDEPPSPQVIGISADAHGLLWVLIAVADANWTPELDDDVDGIIAMIDTRVLAINTRARAVIGETLLDEVCLPAGGSLISCVYDFDQVIRVRNLGLVMD